MGSRILKVNAFQMAFKDLLREAKRLYFRRKCVDRAPVEGPQNIIRSQVHKEIN